MIEPYFPMRVDEILDFQIDMREWLRTIRLNETIANVSAFTSDDKLLINQPLEFTDQQLVIRLSGGPGGNHKVVVTVEVDTSAGQSKTVQFGIQSLGPDQPPLPVINVMGGVVTGP